MWRRGLAGLVMVWLMAGPVGAAAPSKVAVVIVDRHSVPMMRAYAEAVQDRITALAQQAGLALPVTEYDFDADADRQHCITDLKVGPNDLLYVGLVALGPDNQEQQVLFHTENVQDVDRVSRATVQTALHEVEAATPGGEDADQQRRSYQFYGYLLRHPDWLGFHPDPAMIGQLMQAIRTRFVDPISDRQMEAGIAEQVRDLLEVARLPTAALDALSLTSDLPARIEDAYRTGVNADVLTWAEVRGALQPLHDPHSDLLTPLQARTLNGLLGDQPGPGIHVEYDKQKGNQLVVLDAPAQSGLRAGDIVMKVDGHPVAGLSPEAVSGLLQGTAGSRVVITVLRTDGQTDVSLTRSDTSDGEVSSRMARYDIGYIKLTAFGTRSAAQVAAALTRLRQAGARGLLIDLRNNGGGYVKAAQLICSLFVPKGETIVSLVGRDGARQDIKSLGPGDRVWCPIALLVNGHSASASEITAACLQDHHVAVLFGTRTYGKGSMQRGFEFPGHSLLKLTIARFYSPSGDIIDGLGVEPDIEVPLESGWDDSQVVKALEYLHFKMEKPGP